MKTSNSRTRIYQSNMLTFASYNYSFIQEKIMTTVMYNLQHYITPQFKANCAFNREKFLSNIEEEYIQIEFHPSIIVKPQQNKQLRDSLKKLSTIPVELRSYDENREIIQYEYTGLLDAKLILENNRTTRIQISVKKKVACQLIEFERNKYNQPINYTSFFFECILFFKSKYSFRIYTMLCSWRSKRKYEITLDEFRRQLKIEGVYQRFSDIKKNVLIPAQKDLVSFGDCWFDCNDDNFIDRKNRQVYKINFFIITKEDVEASINQRDAIQNLLKMYFKYNDDDFEEIEGLLNKNSIHQSLNMKIIEVYNRVIDDYTIKDRKQYIKKCISNEFNPIS